ncbi:hypothetical protein LguiA_014223 [Lonicera macranthoides]
MGCIQNLICTICVLFLLFSTSTHFTLIAEGNWVAIRLQEVKEEKGIWRAQIGSRPPRCERRCSSCEHCEAIQVPTNPQIRSGTKNSTTVSVPTAAYSRGNYNSNYKPMSWKCKCGKFIFNP